jgi:hypothetical protein
MITPRRGEAFGVSQPATHVLLVRIDAYSSRQAHYRMPRPTNRQDVRAMKRHHALLPETAGMMALQRHSSEYLAFSSACATRIQGSWNNLQGMPRPYKPMG